MSGNSPSSYPRTTTRSTRLQDPTRNRVNTIKNLALLIFASSYIKLSNDAFFLKFWWPNATLFAFIFLWYSRYIHTSFIHKHSLRPISISSQLSAQWAEPPWGAEIRTWACLTASQRASATNWATLHPYWATLHPTEPHCTLLSHTAHLLSYSYVLYLFYYFRTFRKSRAESQFRDKILSSFSLLQKGIKIRLETLLTFAIQ